jgi:hypothetical protein
VINDAFRKDPRRLGKLVITRSIMEHDDASFAARALQAVQAFDGFDAGNDPYGEHDFVAVEVDGLKVFGKIDYYDLDMEGGSPDPGDPAVTARVLTIMLAEDY